MIIDRLFWVRFKNDIMMAFSYDKDKTTTNMATKYGGRLSETLEFLDEDTSIRDALAEATTVYSVLENQNPTIVEGSSEEGDFKVYAKSNGKWDIRGSFASVSDANTEAKNLIKTNEKVVVFK